MRIFSGENLFSPTNIYETFTKKLQQNKVTVMIYNAIQYNNFIWGRPPRAPVAQSVEHRTAMVLK